MANLTPLPEGWSLGGDAAVSREDLKRLERETSPRILPYLDRQVTASTQDFASDADGEDEEDEDTEEERDMTEEEMAEIAAEKGFHVSDLTGVFSNVSQHIIDEDLDVWGFVIFKTWGFGADSASWDKFWMRWQQLMENHLRTSGMTGDLRTGLAGRLIWHVEEAKGATIKEVRERYEELVYSETLPVGLELDLCLVIDESSARTLLNPKEGVVPYVTGVMSDRAKKDAGNQGYFQIAMDVLVPDVWYLLCEASPAQIDPGNGIMYRGALTEDADGGIGKRELIPLS